jgi:outer membrane lipoprotein-sorting protein
LKQLEITIKFCLYVFLIILSCHASYAVEENKSAIIQIKKFFENLITLEANFIQVSPSGNVSNGKVYLDLPGKLRIDYEKPKNLLITCKGFWIVIQDRESKTTNNIPLKNSPFALLLENTSFLNNQNIKTEYNIEAGIISLKLKSQNKDNQESLVLEFSENPFSLKKWVIQDSLGENTTVLIQNAKYNNKLSHLLFFPIDFPEPTN